MKKTDGMIERLYEESGNPQEVIRDLQNIFRQSHTSIDEVRDLHTWRLSDMPKDLQERWLSANDEEKKRQIIGEYHKREKTGEK